MFSVKVKQFVLKTKDCAFESHSPHKKGNCVVITVNTINSVDEYLHVKRKDAGSTPALFKTEITNKLSFFLKKVTGFLQ